MYKFIYSISFLCQAKNNSTGTRRGPVVVDVESGEIISCLKYFVLQYHVLNSLENTVMCFFVHFSKCDGMNAGVTSRSGKNRTRLHSDRANVECDELNKSVRDVLILFLLV